MPGSPRHRLATALLMVGASLALAVVAGGPALVTASWIASAHRQQLTLTAASEREGHREAEVTASDEAAEALELDSLLRRSLTVRTAAAVLAGTVSPVPSDSVGSKTAVVVTRVAPDESSPRNEGQDSLGVTLVELQNALARRDVSAARRLVHSVEQAVLAAAVATADDAVQSVEADRAASADRELVDRLDRAALLTHLAAAARAVRPSARHAAQARELAASLHATADPTRVADEPAADGTVAAQTTDGYDNGMIPLEALCPVSFAPAHRLRCDAADALDRLNTAFRAALGTDLTLSDSYRSLGGQYAVKKVKPFLAATPGTSNHGWGLAVDLSGGVESYDSRPYAWLKQHATEYGWRHPPYMDRGGSGPHEPWHWEFGTTDHHPSASNRDERSSAVLPDRTEPAPATLVPSSSHIPPSDPVPVVVPSSAGGPVSEAQSPVVLSDEPIEDSSPAQSVPPALLEPSLPDPVPPASNQPADVSPACTAQTIQGSSGLPPLPDETAPEAEVTSSPASPSPAGELVPPASSDEPPPPACPAHLDQSVDDHADRAIPSDAAAVES